MRLFNHVRLARVFRSIGFPVGAAALALAVQAAESAASTGSSEWNSQPSWSSPATSPSQDADSASSRPRRSTYRDVHTKAITPYSPGSNNVALDVGQVFLMGGLGNNYSDAIGTQLHYTYGVSDLFGFDSSLGYSSHSDGAFSMTTLLTGVRMNLAWYDKIVPYTIGGLGFYRPSYSQTITSGSDTTTESLSPLLFGVHVGAGADLALTQQLFFGASLTLHDVFGSERVLPSGAPIEAGGTFLSFLLHAGVTF